MVTVAHPGPLWDTPLIVRAMQNSSSHHSGKAPRLPLILTIPGL